MGYPVRRKLASFRTFGPCPPGRTARLGLFGAIAPCGVASPRPLALTMVVPAGLPQIGFGCTTPLAARPPGLVPPGPAGAKRSALPWSRQTRRVPDPANRGGRLRGRPYLLLQTFVETRMLCKKQMSRRNSPRQTSPARRAKDNSSGIHHWAARAGNETSPGRDERIRPAGIPRTPFGTPC